MCGENGDLFLMEPRIRGNVGLLPSEDAGNSRKGRLIAALAKVGTANL